MSRLWTPPSVTREMRDETDQHSAEVLQMVERFRGVMDHWTDRARELDPRLECIFAPPTHKSEEVGMVPGRYYWLRHNDPGVPPTLIPIETPEGGFREPTDRDVEDLRGQDLQNPRAVRDRQRARRLAREAEERVKVREREERAEELRDRFRAAFETSISMNSSAPWSQNASPTARRAAREQAKKKAA